MSKFFIKYTLIILINLFAFFSIWHILDGIFNTKGMYTVICLVLSIVSLTLIAFPVINNALQSLNDIKPKKDDKNSWK